MKTIQDVILNNQWKSSSFMASTDVNRLFNSGIVSNASDQAQALINAIDYDNVQATVRVGMVGYDWAEQNLGDASDTVVTALQPMFDEVNAKTFYGNQWWGVKTIQRDLMNTTQPNRLVLETVGRYWAKMYNKLISATLSGLSTVAEITVGDGTANLSRKMVIEARKRKGDMGFGKLANMYMSSGTLADILEKQADGAAELITERYGLITIVQDGVTQTVQNDTPEYVYGGVTSIIVDDAIADGVISLVEDGAFAFAQKDLLNPLAYVNDPKSGNGAGAEEWGTKAVYLLHPVGFNFVGVHGTDYESRSGLTIAELQGGGLYELNVDAKLAPITNLKVKMGTV